MKLVRPFGQRGTPWKTHQSSGIPYSDQAIDDLIPHIQATLRLRSEDLFFRQKIRQNDSAHDSGEWGVDGPSSQMVFV